MLWLCIIIVGLGLPLPGTNPKTIDLAVIYDCTKVTLIAISDYPSLRDCNHSMSKTNDPVLTYNAEIHKYEPKNSKFSIHHCQCFKITGNSSQKNIFKGSTIARNEIELPVSAINWLQAIKYKTANVVPTVLTLQKTSRHN